MNGKCSETLSVVRHMMYTQIMDALIDGSALIEKPYPNGVGCQTHQPKIWVPSKSAGDGSVSEHDWEHLQLFWPWQTFQQQVTFRRDFEVVEISSRMSRDRNFW